MAKQVVRQPKPMASTRHHMIPKSRCRSKPDQKSNIKKVPRKIHEAWHTLFGNLTPFEVVECIVRYFPQKDSFIYLKMVIELQGVRQTFKLTEPKTFCDSIPHLAKFNMRAWNIVFSRRRTVFDAVILVIESWAPKGYFKEVEIRYHHPDGGEATYEYPVQS